jgi:hypothetical protein
MSNQILNNKESKEWGVVLIGSFVFILFCGLLQVIFYENLIKNGIFYLYFIGFSLFPIFLYIIERYSGFFTKSGSLTISGWVVLVFNLLFFFRMSLSPDLHGLFFGVFFLIMASFILLILREALFEKNNSEVTLGPTGTIVMSAAIFGIFLLGFLNTFVEHMLFDSYDGIVAEIPNWGGFPAILMCVFAIFSAYVLSKNGSEGEEKHRTCTLFVCFTPLLLFSIQAPFDLDHYDAFVGPAIAVLHGRIPLIDVFSQYGLGYLMFTLAFLILPNTYVMCATLVSLINIVTFISYLLILRTLIKNPYQFTLVGIVSVFGVYFCNSMSMNLLPSSLGLRYFPAMIFLYFLVQGKNEGENKLKRNQNIVFLLLNAFWSIECLVFYFLIAGFYCWLKTHKIKSVFSTLMGLFAQLLLAVMVFCGLYFLMFKQFPRYDVYIAHPLSYLTGRHDSGSFTENIGQFDGRYLFFFPMAFLSIIFFYYSLMIARKNNENPVLNKLYLVNFSGIVFFVYVAVHSFVFHIKAEWILFLPAFFGALFFVKEKSIHFFFRCLSTILIWITVLVFFCILVVRIVYVMPSNSGPNDALLYHLIHYNKFIFKNFGYNFTHFCNNQNYRNDNGVKIFVNTFQYACKKYDFHEEMHEIIERYYKTKKEAIIFSVSAVEILFEHNKYHPIFVNPMNDISVDVTQKNMILKKIDLIKYGDIIVVDKNVGLDLFQLNILKELSGRFGFGQVEETENLWVLELNDKKNSNADEFLSKRNFRSYFGSNHKVNYHPSSYIKNVNIRDYFYHGDVMTIQMDFDEPFLITAIKFWHLFNSKDILKNKFFSDDEIKNFNVLVSEDKKKWNMVVSENNYFINDKEYYYKEITPIMAKYVRLNVLIDKPNIIIPNIEVFGEKERQAVLHSGH